MDFSEALKACKGGRAIQRAGWNGKGMYVQIQRVDPSDAGTHTRTAMGLPYLYLLTADGRTVPWTISQTDALAEDWQIV